MLSLIADGGCGGEQGRIAVLPAATVNNNYNTFASPPPLPPPPTTTTLTAVDAAQVTLTARMLLPRGRLRPAARTYLLPHLKSSLLNSPVASRSLPVDNTQIY